VEGAGGIGRPLAQKLLAAGERVVDVPPKLSSRVRVLSTGNARKNDALDATFTALAALRNERLARVQPEDGLEGRVVILRLLTEWREDLVAERTRALNRLHVLLRDLLSDGARRRLSADAAAKLLRRARPDHAAGRTRKRLPPSWCAMCRRPRSEGRHFGGVHPGGGGGFRHHPHRALRRRIDSGSEDHRDRGRRREVPQQGTLRLLRGGVAPIEASSGEVLRHRVSLGATVASTFVMHMIVVSQARSDPRGKAYYRKKLGEGKSRREAMRCLKRRISDLVFKALVADSTRASLAVA
jgi:transposase